MHDILLDASYNLYRISTYHYQDDDDNNNGDGDEDEDGIRNEDDDEYNNLFRPSHDLSSTALNTHSQSLTRFLQKHTPEYRDDFEEDREQERMGGFQECRIGFFLSASSSSSSLATTDATSSGIIHQTERRQKQRRRSITIELVYAKQIHVVVLLSRSLALVKCSPGLFKKVLEALGVEFSSSSSRTEARTSLPFAAEPLKLEPRFLKRCLANFITFLSLPSASASTAIEEYNEDEDLHRLSILKTAVGNLRLTISVTLPAGSRTTDITHGGVTNPAPLRTIDLDVPYDTIDTLLSPTNTSNSSISASTNPPLTKGMTFLTNLQHYITEHTGLKIPLVFPDSSSSSSTSNNTNNNNHNNENNDAEKFLKLSRFSTSLLALSTEGKVKISSRSLNTVQDTIYEAIVEDGVWLVLDLLVFLAKGSG